MKTYRLYYKVYLHQVLPDSQKPPDLQATLRWGFNPSSWLLNLITIDYVKFQMINFASSSSDFSNENN